MIAIGPLDLRASGSSDSEPSVSVTKPNVHSTGSTGTIAHRSRVVRRAYCSAAGWARVADSPKRDATVFAAHPWHVWFPPRPAHDRVQHCEAWLHEPPMGVQLVQRQRPPPVTASHAAPAVQPV